MSGRDDAVADAFTSAESYGRRGARDPNNDRRFRIYHDDPECDGPEGDGACYQVSYHIEQIFDPTEITIGVPIVQYAQDPNYFTATVFTPGSPIKPRRRLPVSLYFNGAGGTQDILGTSNDDGLAAPLTLITLPAGNYQLKASWPGNGLLLGTAQFLDVVIAKDFTSSSLTIDDEIRWGHHDPMTGTLIEPNVGQLEPALPIAGKTMTFNFQGLTASKTFSAGPTDVNGNVTATPLMDLPPGKYQVTACFAEDPWFLGSCSSPKTVKITAGFAAFATAGPVVVSGTHQTSLGDLHSEGALQLAGVNHVLSAGPGERLEYVTTFTNNSTGSVYNLFKVAALGIAPQYLASTYCAGGMTELMGVPITRITGDFKIQNNSTISGIYCVTGSIKIQSTITGTAVLVAAGTITTSGGNQNLTTADPTGADLLMLSGSNDDKAISIGANDSFFRGALVAKGGDEVTGMNTLVDPVLVGRKVTIGGSNNVLDGRTASSSIITLPPASLFRSPSVLLPRFLWPADLAPLPR